jgi:hypothetical protein
MLIWWSILNSEKKLCLQNALVEGNEASLEETSIWLPLTLTTLKRKKKTNIFFHSKILVIILFLGHCPFAEDTYFYNLTCTRACIHFLNARFMMYLFHFHCSLGVTCTHVHQNLHRIFTHIYHQILSHWKNCALIYFGLPKYFFEAPPLTLMVRMAGLECICLHYYLLQSANQS